MYIKHYNLNEIVNNNRDTSSGYHFVLGRSWRLIGEERNSHTPLAYSAFEYRLCIERSCFELFVLIRRDRLSERELRYVNRLSTLIKHIYKISNGEETFNRIVKFNRLFASSTGISLHMCPSEINLHILEKYWQDLSEYCHRQLEPRKSWESMGNSWINKGYTTIRNVENYLFEVTVKSPIGWVPIDELEPEMKQARDDFINGNLDEKSLLKRIEIMSPILEDRKNKIKYL